jgi:hypothetical protein
LNCQKQKARRDYLPAGYVRMSLLCSSGGAAQRIDASFCSVPLHSARYDRVPHAVFAELAFVDSRFFLPLLSRCLIDGYPKTSPTDHSISQSGGKGKEIVKTMRAINSCAACLQLVLFSTSLPFAGITPDQVIQP